MAALDFNGTGANTSNVRTSTVAAIFGTAPFTMIAMLLPDSAGQSNSGCIMSTGTSGNANRKRFLLNASRQLRLVVQRNTTSTEFIASNRAIVATASEPSKAAALVAATFDDAASPKVKLFSSSDGTTNQAPVAETTYGTSTAGAGTINSEGANGVLVAGNLPGGAATFDGGMLWQAYVPAVVSLEVLQALASGVNPVDVLGTVAGTRIVWFGPGDGTALDLLDPTQAWTATAVTVIDGPATYGGGAFTPGSGQALTTAAAQASSGTSSITAATAVVGSGVAAKSSTSSLTASTAFTSTGTSGRLGTSSLSSATGITGSGTAARSGTSPITATTACTGEGRHAATDTSAISAATLFTASGTSQRVGSSSTTAATAFDASGQAQRQGVADITAATDATSSGIANRFGSTTITAATDFVVTGDGIETPAGTATITAATSVTGTGVGEVEGSGAFHDRLRPPRFADDNVDTRFGHGTITARTDITGAGLAELNKTAFGAVQIISITDLTGAGEGLDPVGLQIAADRQAAEDQMVLIGSL